MLEELIFAAGIGQLCVLFASGAGASAAELA